MWLEGIISKKAQAEVLLGRGRPHTGITEFALDRSERSSFRKIQPAPSDWVAFANPM